MHSITFSYGTITKTIKLDNHTKETFIKELNESFEGADMMDIETTGTINIPAIFKRVSVDSDSVLADSFWSWMKLDDNDKSLLVHYMEVTQDTEKTIDQAKIFLNQKKAMMPR